MAPGATALARTPYFACSSAIPIMKACTKPLLAP